jgi:hypothetical protein
VFVPRLLVFGGIARGSVKGQTSITEFLYGIKSIAKKVFDTTTPLLVDSTSTLLIVRTTS